MDHGRWPGAGKRFARSSKNQVPSSNRYRFSAVMHAPAMRSIAEFMAAEQPTSVRGRGASVDVHVMSFLPEAPRTFEAAHEQREEGRPALDPVRRRRRPSNRLSSVNFDFQWSSLSASHLIFGHFASRQSGKEGGRRRALRAAKEQGTRAALRADTRGKAGSATREVPRAKFEVPIEPVRRRHASVRPFDVRSFDVPSSAYPEGL